MFKDSNIDFDEELGDASEVYDVTAESPMMFRAETPHIHMTENGEAAGRLLVDEIYDGEIAFSVVAEEGDAEVSLLSKLGPSDARQVAAALLRGAEYAERQLESEATSSQ